MSLVYKYSVHKIWFVRLSEHIIYCQRDQAFKSECLYRALGLLAAKLGSDGGNLLTTQPDEGLSPTLHQLIGNLQQLLSRNVATHKMVASLVIAEWVGCPKEQFLSALTSSLSEQGGYEEITPFILALQKDCHVRHMWEPFF